MVNTEREGRLVVRHQAMLMVKSMVEYSNEPSVGAAATINALSAAWDGFSAPELRLVAFELTAIALDLTSAWQKAGGSAAQAIDVITRRGSN